MTSCLIAMLVAKSILQILHLYSIKISTNFLTGKFDEETVDFIQGSSLEILNTVILMKMDLLLGGLNLNKIVQEKAPDNARCMDDALKMRALNM